jgi:hypothetical protein
MGGSYEPRSWKGMKETTQPSGGADTSLSPGMTHSNTSVLAGRRPRLTRLSMRAWMMAEWHHGSMRLRRRRGEGSTSGGE